MKPIVFFDLETTGADVAKDQIVQIACLKWDGEKIFDEKMHLVKPTIPIEESATDVHGISMEDLEDKPTFKQLANGILDYFAGCDIGGYNSNRFDVPILMAEFKRAGIKFDIRGINFVDVLAIERKLHSQKLVDVYKRYTGDDLVGAHDAMADVLATVKVLEHQQKELGSIDALALDEYSQGDNKRVDLAGKLKYNDEGKLCWNFGRNKHKPVIVDQSYLSWFLSTNPPVDTVALIEDEIYI